MHTRRSCLLAGFTLLSIASAKLSPMSNTKYILYAGTYGKGIYGSEFDPSTGELQPLSPMGELANSSFLATDPAKKYLFAVSELEGKEKGAVASFKIDHATGKLSLLSTQSSDGLAPCHLSTDATGKMLVAANYTSGNAVSYPIDADGKIGSLVSDMTASGSGPHKGRQEGPHAHESVFSANNKFVYVPDLGLDQIRIFSADPATAKLTPATPPHVQVEPGIGPRHIVFSPNDKFAYVMNELKPDVTVFSHDSATGMLTHVQTIASVEDGTPGDPAPAEVLIDKAGKYVYASNRGPGTIAVFSVDHATGKLSRIQVAETGGTWPRGVEFDPSGHYLLAGDQKADRIAIFKVDPHTGKLALTGKAYPVPSPVSFVFVPAKS
jgi:6-phosphogluconolactonase